MDFRLINEKLVSIKEVLDALDSQSAGTPWAARTNGWAKDLAQKFSEHNSGIWVRGSLPFDLLKAVVLPGHAHPKNDAPFTIPKNTPCAQALEIYKNRKRMDNNECLDLIEYLREQIKSSGFTDSVVLGVKEGLLHHIDGLHRVLAISSLVDEGMHYEPIPVFLSRPY